MTEQLKQAEALRLADWLQRCAESIEHVNAAAELRRLHVLTTSQPAQAGEVDERVAFIEWLETTWPKCYPKGTGTDYWRNGHLSALAWKAARASLPTQPAAQATPEPVGDVRCEGCGYMTHHREHMGCVRAAKQHTRPAPVAPDVEDLRDRLVAISAAVADCDDRAAQSMLGEILRMLAAPQAKGGE